MNIACFYSLLFITFIHNYQILFHHLLVVSLFVPDKLRYAILVQ
jgi:hypothetical protein